jgi:hypothetical protein
MAVAHTDFRNLLDLLDQPGLRATIALVMDLARALAAPPRLWCKWPA